MTDEELHLVVQAQTGKESMRSLTKKEIARVVYVLGQMKDSAQGKKRKIAPCGTATDNQRRKVYALAKELGWDNPKRVNGMVRRLFKIDCVEWLDYTQCSDLIEAMKAMVARKEQKERKKNS